MILQLAPEESSGMSRRTIPPEIIRTQEFQWKLQQGLTEIEHLQGGSWWQQMEDVAHSISAEWKGKSKQWHNSLWKMEEALKLSTTRKLTGAAKKPRAEHGEGYSDPNKGYQQLHLIITKRRAQQRRQHLVTRLKEAMAGKSSQDEDRGVAQKNKKKQRQEQIVRLLQQMSTRKQTVVIKLQNGISVSGVDNVGAAMGQFWDSVMQSPGKTATECEQFIQSIRPPGSWKSAMARLWKMPSYDLV